MSVCCLHVHVFVGTMACPSICSYAFLYLSKNEIGQYQGSPCVLNLVLDVKIIFYMPQSYTDCHYYTLHAVHINDLISAGQS